MITIYSKLRSQKLWKVNIEIILNLKNSGDLVINIDKDMKIIVLKLGTNSLSAVLQENSFYLKNAPNLQIYLEDSLKSIKSLLKRIWS
jgi:primase-polymerase (primpol)-like protein